MSITYWTNSFRGRTFADDGRFPILNSANRELGKPLSQLPEVRACESQEWRQVCTGRRSHRWDSGMLIGNKQCLRACSKLKLDTNFLVLGNGRRILNGQRGAGHREQVGSPWSAACSAKEEFSQYLDINGDAIAEERSFESVAERDLATKEVGFLEEGYIGLFVRLLGLDNSDEDREASVRALWKHSMRGKQCVDEIMKFPGCLALIVRLLSSDRAASSEAAAGLLRNISMIHAYRSDVANAGAIEEIAGILTRRSICSEAREQATCVLWNLSVEEKLRHKIANAELLQVLVVMLGSSEGEREAAAGVMANLALSECNHDILVEAGAIPKMANILKDTKVSKVTRQEARNALLELVKDTDNMLYILEEGLVPVPLIGASAYQSFKPLLDVAPALPEDVKVEMSSPLPSTFGAQGLLLGLNIERGGYEIDDATELAIEGRVRQHFLARVGVLEKQVETKPEKDCKTITIMPWWDGIPRLVLILGLEDVTVAKLAADTISDIAVTEEMRQAVHKAGAVPHLVRLLGCGDEATTESATSALEKLSISYKVRRSIDAHGAVPALVALLKADDAPFSVRDKVVSTLARLSQTGEEIKAMIQSGTIPGLVDIVESIHSTSDAKAEAVDILEEMSLLKEDSRDRIIIAGGVPPLIQILQSGNASQKEKAACVLENLATKEPNAECIVNLGVEYALKATLEALGLEEKNGISDSCAVFQAEETWCAVAAVSRLLDRLLRFEKIRNSLDCKYFAISLANILKAGAPLYVKDWISACLLKLERLAGISRNIGIPIDLEVTVHDIIPRLITEIGTSSSGVQERAAVQLQDLVLMGIPDYTTAIGDSGGIFPLVELLDKGTPRAREAALAVLYNICMNEENRSTILAAGAVTHLERLIRSGGSQWKLALYLLRALPT